MESQPAFLRTPGSNACWESESKPSGQHRKGNISPETSTNQVDARGQGERCSSRESTGHVKSLKHTALASTANPGSDPLPASTAASRIPTMHSATTKQVTAGTVNTTATTKIASKQPAKTTAPGVELLSLSGHAGSSGPKLRSPITNHEMKLQANAKMFPKNIQKTASASHIMGSTESPQKTLHKTSSVSQISSTDSPRSLTRASLSHIPRATSSPKLKPSSPASLKVDKTERNRRGKEGLPSTSPMKDKMIDTLAESELGESPLGQQEIKTPPSLHPTANPEDKTDAYVTTQERQSQREQKEREDTEEKDKTSKNLKDAVTMTGEAFLAIQTEDAALQTDLHPVYTDAEIQAVVELCSRSTEMTPVHDSDDTKVNDLNPDSKSDSDWFPTVSSMVPKPMFLGPPPYKSPNIQKPHQHVCQIEIELCSKTPPQVTINEFDAACQVDKDESSAPQEIVWDEQGMTWEVYGASLDMESLGFAIQNHLQCKIREHERRIGTLRKSICLSEQSPGKDATGKRKRNIFRSLFAGSNCCSKPRPKEGMAK